MRLASAIERSKPGRSLDLVTLLGADRGSHRSDVLRQLDSREGIRRSASQGIHFQQRTVRTVSLCRSGELARWPACGTLVRCRPPPQIRHITGRSTRTPKSVRRCAAPVPWSPVNSDVSPHGNQVVWAYAAGHSILPSVTVALTGRMRRRSLLWGSMVSAP